MARHKSAQNVPILPWLSGKRDCKEGRFIQVGNSFLQCSAVKALRGNVLKTYLALAMESGGKPTAKLSHEGAERKYGIDRSTFTRSIKKLIEAGFIVLDFDDNQYRYETNVYRFKTDWKTQ